jgi:uncharacterized membrane protein (UPF0127 family)
VSRPPHFLSPLFSSATGTRGFYLEGSSKPLAATVETAFDSVARKRGLLGRDDLPTDYALVIAPCNLVHTFKMKFVIDVIFAARSGRIVKLRREMPPGRISGAFGAFATIEMVGGSIERAGLTVGKVIMVR